MSEPKVHAVMSSGDSNLLLVQASWFESAFECAYGATVPEMLRSLAAQIAVVETALQNSRNTEDVARTLEALRIHCNVGAEWAERLEEHSTLVGGVP
jgi:hypothetical protein